MITREDVERAAGRIADRVRRTPVLAVAAGELAPVPIWFKLEYLQHTGSFKPRGMFNRVLAAQEADGLPAAGLVTASGGNAGLAVAHVGSSLGVRAEVYVPTAAPAYKVARLRELGATVVQQGAEFSEANQAAMRRHVETGALYCHAYDQPDVAAGQGTLALELLDQVDGVDTVLVAVGGGGLIAGIAAALEGRVRVVGIEPEPVPTLHAAFAAGRPVDVAVGGVAVDSLGARRLGDIAFDVAVRSGARSVLVGDDSVVEARRALWQQLRVVTEHGAAAALAALRTGAYVAEPGERVAVILCGANTDPATVTG